MISPIEQAIIQLQAAKEEHYGVEWKKRGFVSSYFNTGRKLERFVTMWRNGWQLSGDQDTRLDTLIDMMNYGILNFLLHGEKFPELLKTILQQHKLSLDTSQLVASRQGFRFFCEEILWEVFRQHPLPYKTWEELIEDLIHQAQESVDAWLDHLALVSEDKAPGTTLYEGRFHPEERMKQLLNLIVLSYFAVVQHSLKYPEEWQRFLNQHSM